jgi:hypothetical protein
MNTDGTLYVDVDDCLIRWITDDEFEPSDTVLAFLHSFEGNLVIWSTGGKAHAEAVAAMYVKRPYICMSKQPMKFNPTDIIIDDDPIPGFEGVTVLHPLDLEEGMYDRRIKSI